MSLTARPLTARWRCAPGLLAGALLCACSMPNPAFGELPTGSLTGTDAATNAATGEPEGTSAGSMESTTGELSGTDSASDSGASTSPPATTGATSTSTSTSTSPATSTSGVESSTGDIATSDPMTEPATTGAVEDCLSPCDDAIGYCVAGEPPTAVNCFNDCEAAELCDGDAQACEVVNDVATCVNAQADECESFVGAYTVVIENPLNKVCIFNSNCQTVAGSCAIEGGDCWHALNTSVNASLLTELTEAYADALCEADCTCEGLAPPQSACEGAQCVLVE